MEFASVNGQIFPLAEAKISVLDRGFLFGDSVYEVLRVYSGKPFLLEAHFLRLEKSLKGLQLPPVDLTALEKTVLALLKKSTLPEATIYIQISRGIRHTRQHVFSSETPTPPGTEVVFVTAYDDTKNAVLREKGAKAVIFPDIRWGRVDLKTTNLLGNVFAAEAAKAAGAYEAIFVNEKGFVTEGSHTNVFALVNGKLKTFPLNASVLPGVTRAVILKNAQEQKVPLEETPLTKQELLGAEEVFVSATTAEVMPITDIDGHKIGTGKPGEVSLRLQAAYQEQVEWFLRP